MRAAMTVLALILLLAVHPVRAMDLKGVAIGEPWDRKRIEGAFHQGQDMGDFALKCDEDMCWGFADIGACSANVTVNQVDGKVSSITVDFPPSFFATVADGLLQKFGKPAASAKVAKQNAFGARLTSRTYMWKKNGETLFADEYMSFDRSIVTLSKDSSEPADKSSL